MVDFGKRAKTLVSIDEETGQVTFRIKNGTIITWNVGGLEGLTPFQKSVHLFGVTEKVKNSLAGVGLGELEETISKFIARIDAGEFPAKGSTVGKVKGLTELQTAYARAMSKVHADKAGWANTDDEGVIAEVREAWEGKSAKERGALRHVPQVMVELGLLRSEDEGDDALV